MYSLVSPNIFCKNASEWTKTVVRVRADRPIITLPKRGPIQLPGRRTARVWTSEEFDANRALLIMFLCDHCPYVQHLRQEIVKLASCYMEKGLGVLAITSCSVSVTTHPEDGPDFLSERTRSFDYPFPYWYDKDDDGESFVLEYHGQFDDSRPDNDVPVTGRDLRIAIDCVLNGIPVPSDQKPCPPLH